MVRLLVLLAALPFCLTGICVSLDVRQSPSLIKRPGDKVQISCSHDKTDYTLMLWYQRSPGDTALKLIGYLYYQAVTMEEPYKESFNISGDLSGVKNGSLTVKAVKLEHGVSLGLDVRQSPSELIKPPGDKVQISCSHDRTDYRVILWYQRSPGDTALKLIGRCFSGGSGPPVSLCSHQKGGEDVQLFCTHGHTDYRVDQSPSAVIRKAGEDVQLFCTHGHTDYRVMLWYQQPPGDKALELIGYGYSKFTNDSVEQRFRKHFKLAGDLTISCIVSIIIVFWVKGVSLSNDKVFQTPSELIKEPNSEATLSLEHQIPSYYTLFCGISAQQETRL
ncbi:hypothetical protein JOQ06_021893 [Pogonophryne albipinna]|uniref:Ig-like domain-containing protein n=1 Tax=Pogonophryne albipinna TaxID=1090488 RepID=A0AAD6A8P7_9TELE|nr:hypothetical protein JOQ06_021893 [Pogonophryne albipinna]